MVTAQHLTELGDLNGMNEACLLGKGKDWSMASTLPTGIRPKSAREALKAMADNFDRLKDGNFALTLTATNQRLLPQKDDQSSHTLPSEASSKRQRRANWLNP